MILQGAAGKLVYDEIGGWAVFADDDVVRNFRAETEALEAADAAGASVACFTPADPRVVEAVPGYRWDEHSLSGGPEEIGIASGRLFAIKLGKDAKSWMAEFRKQYGAGECLAAEVSMLAHRDGRKVVSLPDLAWPPPARKLPSTWTATGFEPGYRRFGARWGERAKDASRKWPWPTRMVSVERKVGILVLVGNDHPLRSHAAELAEAGACMAVCGVVSEQATIDGMALRRDLSHIPALFGNDDHFSNQSHELVPREGLIVAVGQEAEECALHAKSACGGRFDVVALSYDGSATLEVSSRTHTLGRVPLWTSDVDVHRSPFRGSSGRLAVAVGGDNDLAKSTVRSLAKFRDVDILRGDAESVARADVFAWFGDSHVEVVEAMKGEVAVASVGKFPAVLPCTTITGVVPLDNSVKGNVGKLIKLVDDQREREELARISSSAAERMHPQEVMMKILEVSR